jgi:hypothetical protein
MKEIVYKAADNWFTNWYDKIQWIQQKIYHWEEEIILHSFWSDKQFI